MLNGILASPHASFSLLLSFSRPYRRSNEDDKRSNSQSQWEEKYTEHVARAYIIYLINGTRDVTMCADIVYGNILELTFHRLASFLGCPFLDLHYSRTVYAIAILTSPLRIARYNMVPISRYVKFERSAQRRSHIEVYKCAKHVAHSVISIPIQERI